MFFSRNGDGANFSKIQWQYCLLISPPPKCPSYTTLFKNDTKKIKIIDQKPTKGRHFEVKHCIYNWEIGQKFDLIITFDLRTLLT